MAVYFSRSPRLTGRAETPETRRARASWVRQQGCGYPQCAGHLLLVLGDGYTRRDFPSLSEFSMERFIENTMYASRWLLAPIYFGLSLAVLALSVKFFQELYHILPQIFSLAEADVILKLLSLIDMALVGGLLVMVMLSGYENFVSRLDIHEGTEKLSWLGKMDSSSLKMKVAASIVAISSIHLLKVFMDAKNYDLEYLKWYVIIHLTFVGSAFAMGYLDKVTKHD